MYFHVYYSLGTVFLLTNVTKVTSKMLFEVVRDQHFDSSELSLIEEELTRRGIEYTVDDETRELAEGRPQPVLFRENDFDVLGFNRHEISHMPRLNAESEKELARRIAAGDLIAKNLLINASLRLVASIAHQFSDCCNEADLIQACYFGLNRAAEIFDPTVSPRFSTIAVPYIYGAAINELKKNAASIHIPPKVRKAISEMLAFKAAFEEKNGFAPSDAKTSEALGVDAEELHRIQMLLNVVSLDNDSDDEDRLSLSDTVEDENVEDEAMLNLKHDVASALSTLTEAERLIIEQRFGFGGNIGMTFTELGEYYGITKQAARARVDKILKKLIKLVILKDYAPSHFDD